MEQLVFKRGSRTITGRVDGAVTHCATECKVYGAVHFDVPTNEARQLFNPNRAQVIQEAAPSVSADMRELFITGYTPAEWDKMRNGKVKPMNSYECYQQGERFMTD